MNVIELLQPPDGAQTSILQAYPWTGPHTAARDSRSHISALAQGIHSFDRSLPRPVRFAWHAPQARGRLSYTLEIFRLENDTAPKTRQGRRVPPSDPRWSGASLRRFPIVRIVCKHPWAEVFHLHIATSYAWRVTAHVGKRLVAESPVWSFHTADALPRWIHVPGITNVRDLGGWPLRGGGRIRQGLVYRTSEMNSHVTIREAGRRVLEDELGIRTDLDLRGEGEEVRPVLNDAQVTWINIPIRPYGEIRHEQHHAGYRRIIELFADPARYPILFHCWGGADRAGTVAYMLHALLDGYPEHLAHDYELTTQSVWGERLSKGDWYRTLLEALAGRTRHHDSPRVMVERFLKSIGVQKQTINAIRKLLIEK